MTTVREGENTYSAVRMLGEPGGGARQRRTVLMVSHQFPYPTRAGNERRLVDLTAAFQSSGIRVVSLICPLDSAEFDDRVAAMHASGIEFVAVTVDGRMTGRLVEAKRLASKLDDSEIPAVRKWREKRRRRLGPRLAEMEAAFTSNALVGVFDALIELLDPTCVLAHYAFSAALLTRVPSRVLRAIDTHDVFSSKAENVHLFGINDTTALTAKEEAQLLQCADLVVAVQDEEADVLRELTQDRCEVVTCGHSFQVRNEPFSEECLGRVGFLASANQLNQDGLARFETAIWPTVLSRFPTCRFVVAGDITDEVSPLTPNVDRIGRLTDVSDFYTQIAVAVNPVVAGTGLKIKSIEALAHGRPLVCWPLGAAGLGFDLDGLVVQAANAPQFAREVVDLLGSTALGDYQPASSTDLMRALHPDHVYRQLIRRIKKGGRR